MENTLLRIAKEFNNNGIQWGIGGSLLLKKQSLVNIANDIDILVSVKDISRAVEILDTLANRVTAPIKLEYSTKYFFQYILDGISIDVMSEFTIKHSSGSYVFIFDDKSITDIVTTKNIELRYTSLEDWLIAYMLMFNREKKVAIIWDYFISNGIYHAELIERALMQQLPNDIEEKLQELLTKTNVLFERC